MEETQQQPMDLSAAEAAACVKRTRPELDKDGKPTGNIVEVAVKAGEVFACRVRDDVVTVVTTDGQKLQGKAPAAKGKAA